MQPIVRVLVLLCLVLLQYNESAAFVPLPAVVKNVPKVDGGIKAGMNYERLGGGNWERSMQPGFVIGGFLGVRENVLGFQLEALLNTSKYTFKDVKDSAQKGNFRAAYFNVPFLLQYKLLGKATLPKLWLLCGPQYSGLLSVKSLNDYNTTGDILRKSNFGVVLGLEARFLRFSAGARYIHGLEDINNDVIKAAGGTWSTRSLQFTAGVKFL
jgi:hypothetical protein